MVDRGPAGDGAWFDVDVSAETVARTNIRGGRDGLGRRAAGSTSSGRSGSATSSAGISSRATSTGWPRWSSVRDEGDSTRISFRAPEALARFIAPKGSVALNGTSLTVNEVEGARFGVNIIPHTRTHTTWGRVAAGRPRQPRDRHAGPLRRAAGRYARHERAGVP